jgi:hypothetical protein
MPKIDWDANLINAHMQLSGRAAGYATRRQRDMSGSCSECPLTHVRASCRLRFRHIFEIAKYSLDDKAFRSNMG